MTVITTVGTAERHLPAERATLVARGSVSDADRATATNATARGRPAVTPVLHRPGGDNVLGR